MPASFLRNEPDAISPSTGDVAAEKQLMRVLITNHQQEDIDLERQLLVNHGLDFAVSKRLFRLLA